MLDTNIVSQFIRGHRHVDHRMLSTPMHEMVISSITAAELLYGLARRPQATNLHALVMQFLERIDTLPWDFTVASVYASLRADQENRGQLMSSLDMLIAAHAIATNAILVSNDGAFAKVEGLKVSDWTLAD